MKKESLDKLVNEVLAMEQEEAYKAGTIGYMARALIQATMPHSKIDSHEFKRKNGAFKLTILADSEIGLPYGSIPRLLISWITTEAVKTKQRELILGKTLSEFMAELDMIPSGGKWGSITRLKAQMKRLFSASISCTYDDGENWGIRNVTPIERAELWWDPKNPNQASLWESKLLLGTSFFKEITENPVPIDMRALKALKQSPMAIDIYCWLTYRMSYLRNITHIPWGALQVQFGSNYKDLRQFKRRFLNQLKKVLFVYPDAKVKEETDTLLLLPGKSHIKKQVNLPAAIKWDENKLSKEKLITPEQNPAEIDEQKKYAKYKLTKWRADKLYVNKKMERKYAQYRLDAVVEIVENLRDEKEKHKLLKNFETHLTRKGLFDIRADIIRGEHTKPVKEELYHFINSHWTHILEPLKSYDEFCKMIA